MSKTNTTQLTSELNLCSECDDNKEECPIHGKTKEKNKRKRKRKSSSSKTKIFRYSLKVKSKSKPKGETSRKDLFNQTRSINDAEGKESLIMFDTNFDNTRISKSNQMCMDYEDEQNIYEGDINVDQLRDGGCGVNQERESKEEDHMENAVCQYQPVQTSDLISSYGNIIANLDSFRIPLASHGDISQFQQGVTYIDKTEMIYKLILIDGGFYCFLRPRRYGKSLMLSVIRNIFLGKKELFLKLKPQLYIIDKWKWEENKFGVLTLDFSQLRPSRVKDFATMTAEFARYVIEVLHNVIDINKFPDISDGIGMIVYYINFETNKNKKVVILIDEYDSLYNFFVKDMEMQLTLNLFFSEFYRALKGQTENIRFLLITGIMPAALSCMFSTFNSITNITFSHQYSSLVGFTQEEINRSYNFYFNSIGKDFIDEELSKIKALYNGYRFCLNENVDCDTLYNPLDINNHLKNKIEETEDTYADWEKTGEYRVIHEILKHFADNNAIGEKWKEFYQASLGEDGFSITKKLFGATDQQFEDYLKSIRLFPKLLHYCGYLTVQRVEDDMIYFKFPNESVKTAFISKVFAYFPQIDISNQEVNLLSNLFSQKDYHNFFKDAMRVLSETIANMATPYDYVKESLRGVFLSYELPNNFHLKNLLQLFSGSMDIKANETNSKSLDRKRCDLTFSLKEIGFCFELKMGMAMEEAIEQIFKNNYLHCFTSPKKKGKNNTYHPLLNSIKKEIIFGGICFSVNEIKVAELKLYQMKKINTKQYQIFILNEDKTLTLTNYYYAQVGIDLQGKDEGMQLNHQEKYELYEKKGTEWIKRKSIE